MSHEWQSLWFAATKHPFTALALVPSQPGASLQFVASALADVGKIHGVRRVHLLNAEGLELADARSFVEQLREIGARGEMAVFATDSPLENNVAIPIARAADAIVIGVPLGDGELGNAKQTLEMVGKERVIGSLALDRKKRKS